MREILFRGKRKSDGKWWEGYLTVVFQHTYIEKANENEAFRFVVDPETVGQFTGLTDKNGKRIFEGDIVEVNYDAYPSERGEVFFRNGSFRLKKVSEVLSLYGFLWWCEVIGNIHDNPELLEG